MVAEPNSPARQSGSVTAGELVPVPAAPLVLVSVSPVVSVCAIAPGTPIAINTPKPNTSWHKARLLNLRARTGLISADKNVSALALIEMFDMGDDLFECTEYVTEGVILLNFPDALACGF